MTRTFLDDCPAQRDAIRAKRVREAVETQLDAAQDAEASADEAVLALEDAGAPADAVGAARRRAAKARAEVDRLFTAFQQATDRQQEVRNGTLRRF